MSAPAEKRVVLILADISGYTRFMTAHRKALQHSQMIITELLQTILADLQAPLEVAKLEGDAVFLYAVQDGDWPQARARVRDTLLELFETFAVKLGELVATSICRCEACTSIDTLRLKVLVHAGEALFYTIGGFHELAGVDVIIAHRLLKNSVAKDQYVLVTEPAREALSWDRIDERGEETYDGLEPIPTCIHYPKVRDYTEHAPGAFASSSLGVEILRCEIRREYAEVASHPEKGFHFHTGRRLAELLHYRPEWLEGMPSTAVDRLAGTGNPHLCGPIEPGMRIVDVGSGAGLDSLIAGRAVGATGSVIGVEMTPDMLGHAREAAALAGLPQVEFREGHAEQLPIEDGWADVVISNGVLNLCPDKPTALREMHRVLKPGGCIQIGDILVSRPVPEKAKRNLDLWTG